MAHNDFWKALCTANNPSGHPVITANKASKYRLGKESPTLGLISLWSALMATEIIVDGPRIRLGKSPDAGLWSISAEEIAGQLRELLDVSGHDGDTGVTIEAVELDGHSFILTADEDGRFLFNPIQILLYLEEAEALSEPRSCVETMEGERFPWYQDWCDYGPAAIWSKRLAKLAEGDDDVLWISKP